MLCRHRCHLVSYTVRSRSGCFLGSAGCTADSYCVLRFSSPEAVGNTLLQSACPCLVTASSRVSCSVSIGELCRHAVTSPRTCICDRKLSKPFLPVLLQNQIAECLVQSSSRLDPVLCFQSSRPLPFPNAILLTAAAIPCRSSA